MGIIHVNEPNRDHSNDSSNAQHYYNQHYVTVGYGWTDSSGTVEPVITNFIDNPQAGQDHDGASYEFWDAHTPYGSLDWNWNDWSRGSASGTQRQALTGFSNRNNQGYYLDSSGNYVDNVKVVRGRTHVSPTGVPYMWDSGDTVTGVTTIAWKLKSDTFFTDYNSIFGLAQDMQEWPGFSIDAIGDSLIVGNPGYDENRLKTDNFSANLGNYPPYYSYSGGNINGVNQYSKLVWWGNESHPKFDWLWKREPVWANYGRAFKMYFSFFNTQDPKRSYYSGISVNNVQWWEIKIQGNYPQRREGRTEHRGVVYYADGTETDATYVDFRSSAPSFVNADRTYDDPQYYSPYPEWEEAADSDRMSHVRFGHSVSYSAGINVISAPGNYVGSSPGTAYTSARDMFGEIDNSVTGWDGYGRVMILTHPASGKTNSMNYDKFREEEGIPYVWNADGAIDFDLPNIEKCFLQPSWGTNNSAGKSPYFIHRRTYAMVVPPSKYVTTRSSGVTTCSLVGPEPYDKFGWSVKTRYRKIIIGAPDSNDGRGKAYLYNSDAELLKTLEPVGAAKSFGWSVDIGSGRIAVGDLGGNDGKGSCYIYDLDGCFIGIVTAYDGQVGDDFGHSVSIRSGIVACGAPGATVGIGSTGVPTQCGAVYGFNRDRVSTMHQTPIPGLFDTDGEPYNPARLFKISPSDGEDGDRFGHKVHVASGRVFVGAPQKTERSLHANDDTNSYSDGAAYVHNLGGGFIQKLVGVTSSSNYGWDIACDSHLLAITSPHMRVEDHWIHPRYDINVGLAATMKLGIGNTEIPFLRKQSAFYGTGTNFAYSETRAISYWEDQPDSFWNSSTQKIELPKSNYFSWEPESFSFSPSRTCSSVFGPDTIHTYYTPSVITFYDAIDNNYQ